MTPGTVARWRARAPAERHAVAEAFVTLLAVSAFVKVAPFRTVARYARRRVTAPPPTDPAATIALVAWAVRAAARRARFRAVCIERGVTAQAMLRRRGIAATLHYGVASAASGLTAHVWVRVGPVDVVGCDEAAKFRQVARFEATG